MATAHIFYQTIANNAGIVTGVGAFVVAVTGWQLRRTVRRRTKPHVRTKVKITKVSPLNLKQYPSDKRWWEFWK